MRPSQLIRKIFFSSGVVIYKLLTVNISSTSDPVPKPHSSPFSAKFTLLHHAQDLFSASCTLFNDTGSIHNLKLLSKEEEDSL